MQKIILALVFITFSFVFCVAQTPTPTPKSTENENDVVKISTTLIQIDVTVTDLKGKLVTNLKQEDFEVFENNDKQTITNFSFVSSTSASKSSPTPKPNKNEITAPIPSVQLRPDQVYRTIALVVDDLGLSFESTYQVQRALKKFVDEQMQPNDLVAIIRTGGGIGALQQFTSDKNLLYSAITKIRWNPQGRGGIGTFAANDLDPSTRSGRENEIDKDFEREVNQFRDDNFSVGTLGAINYVVKGMRELPGKKSVMLFSDGFTVCNPKYPYNCNRILNALRELTDICNRASVTIYTQDARGLQSGDFNPFNQMDSSLSIQALTDDLFYSQEGLSYLANATGGKAVLKSNDLNEGLANLLEDTKGYYLIGYQPDSDTFDAKTRKFNKLTVRIKDKNLKVRYRSGFFGVADSDIRYSNQTTQTPAQQIHKALTSPFAVNGITLKLNAIFAKDDKIGSFVHSFLYVEGKDLTFVDEPDGFKKATFNVLAVSFGENGVPLDQIVQTYNLAVKDDAYEKVIKDGFVYNFYFPIKKAGAYQMRVVIRDTKSLAIGSANQFIEVPELKKGRHTLSGIILENFNEVQWKQFQKDSSVSSDKRGTNPMQDTSLRRFKKGTALRYGLEIYNPKFNESEKPNLSTQIKLFKGGKVIYETPPAQYNLDGLTDFTKIPFAGALVLGGAMDVGDYILQIIVIDNSQKNKRKLATQWVQFEIFE